MILKGSQRGGATQLGLHLMRLDENDHVEVHEVRGFLSADPLGAFREAQALSRATKCMQYLFSVSLSPPSSEDVSVAEFEHAVNGLEAKLGLTGQPRVLVFHEKSGRRHAPVRRRRCGLATSISQVAGSCRMANRCASRTARARSRSGFRSRSSSALR